MALLLAKKKKSYRVLSLKNASSLWLTYEWTETQTHTHTHEEKT